MMRSTLRYVGCTLALTACTALFGCSADAGTSADEGRASSGEEPLTLTACVVNPGVATLVRAAVIARVENACHATTINPNEIYVVTLAPDSRHPARYDESVTGPAGDFGACVISSLEGDIALFQQNVAMQGACTLTYSFAHR